MRFKYLKEGIFQNLSEGATERNGEKYSAVEIAKKDREFDVKKYREAICTREKEGEERAGET